MKNRIIEIKYQTVNLCDAMLRNINDNFISVSFDFDSNAILIRVILEKRTETEDNYIDDMVTEFEASQQRRDCLKEVQVKIGSQHFPLRNIAYKKK